MIVAQVFVVQECVIPLVAMPEDMVGVRRPTQIPSAFTKMDRHACILQTAAAISVINGLECVKKNQVTVVVSLVNLESTVTVLQIVVQIRVPMRLVLR